MTVLTRVLKLSVFLALAVWFTMVGQGSSISITPSAPALLAGQTMQLSAAGAVAPTALAVGAGHTCAFYSDRSIRCTGQNNQGEVGNGGWSNVYEPALVGGTTNPVTVRTGMEHTCTLVDDGRMQCWGSNYTGQLGDGTSGGFAVAPQFVQNLAGAIKAVPGGWFTCALLTDHTAR